MYFKRPKNASNIDLKIIKKYLEIAEKQPNF